MPIDVRHVAVVGAGTMGAGIAQVFAQAGYDVSLQDVSQPALDAARRRIEASLDKFVEKGKMARADVDAALGRLRVRTTLEPLAEADFVVEAIV